MVPHVMSGVARCVRGAGRVTTAALAAVASLVVGLVALPAPRAEAFTNTSRTRYTTKIENGDFELYTNTVPNWGGGEIQPTTARIGSYGDGVKPSWFPINGFNWTDFGWDSTQGVFTNSDGKTDQGMTPIDVSADGTHPVYTDNEIAAHGIQIGTSIGHDGKANHFAELVAEDPMGYIYQDVKTTPGAVYVWSLKHASNAKSHDDSIYVVIGPTSKIGLPKGNGSGRYDSRWFKQVGPYVQQGIRITTNGGGDQIGDADETIKTHNATGFDVQDKSDPVDNWETYIGIYNVPYGQTETTRFTFANASGFDGDSGNYLDDISFEVAYPLTYDLNGGTGSVPQGERYDRLKVSSGRVNGHGKHYGAGSKIRLAGTNKQDDADAKSSLRESTTLSRTGYKFMGWSLKKLPAMSAAQFNSGVDSSGRTYKSQVMSTLTMPTGATTVYAVWVSGVNLSYDVNVPSGASATPPATPKSVTGAYGSVLADSSGWTAGSSTAMPGYTFDCWMDTPNGSCAANKHDFTKAMTADQTVYAHWTPISYVVRFNASNSDTTGTMAAQPMTFDSSVELDANAFAEKPEFHKSDGSTGKWTFAGWNTKRDGSGTLYPDKASVKNLTTTSGDIVNLYAQWNRVKATLRFDKNADGATGSVPDMSFTTFMDTTVPPNASKSLSYPGYTFYGWTTRANGTGRLYRDGGRVSPGADDITLYAQWKKTESSTYTVEYYPNNQDVEGTVSPQSVQADSSATVKANGFVEKPEFHKSDGSPGTWTFAGWNTRKDGTGTSYSPGQTVTGTAGSTVKLYAQWNHVRVTLHFDKNASDATGSVSDMTTPAFTGIGFSSRASLLSRPGYTLAGWNTKADGTGMSHPDGTTIFMGADDITLYAQWKKTGVLGVLPLTGGPDGSLRLDGPKLAVELAVLAIAADTVFVALRRRRKNTGR